MRAVLVDAGPLVALFDRSDTHHERVAAALKAIRDPLVTAWPPLVEAMYLLSFSQPAQMALWDLLETGALRLLPLGRDDVPRMRELMLKYHDLPMDLADAALVRLAEREDVRRVLTLDQRHFEVYRIARKGRFTVLP